MRATIASQSFRAGARSRTTRLSIAIHPIHSPARSLRPRTLRYASSLQPSSSSPAPAPLQMPPDMPRENYSDPAMYTLSYVARTIKYLLYGILTVSATSLLAFEGLHLYIEHVSLAAPSSNTHPDQDQQTGGEGWEEENPNWTGGLKGGTSSKLGWKGRHALRAAWICQEWGAGAGQAGSIGSSGGAFASASGGAGTGALGLGARNTRVDRGYELAEEYIDLAIRDAKQRGVVFPPNLPAIRRKPWQVQSPTLPSTAVATTPLDFTLTANIPPASSGIVVDQLAVDLLVLKAGILERINTHASLSQAREVYEQILAVSVSTSSSTSIATYSDSTTATQKIGSRELRWIGKIGDLETRTGGDGSEWWTWGLRHAGVPVSDPTSEPAGRQPIPLGAKEKKGSATGWFTWFNSSSSSRASAGSAPAPTGTVINSHDGPLPTVSPARLRALLSMLVSYEAHLARSGHYAQSTQTQNLALSLIPASPDSQSTTSPAGALQTLWLKHRATLINLHQTSITHLTSPSRSLKLSKATTIASEELLAALPPTPATRGDPLYYQTKLLHRDALLLAAEANYTQAVILEKTGGVPELELSIEGFERAMELSKLESGEEGVKGEEWTRYWNGYIRVREKIDAVLNKGKE